MERQDTYKKDHKAGRSGIVEGNDVVRHQAVRSRLVFGCTSDRASVGVRFSSRYDRAHRYAFDMTELKDRY